MNEPYCGRSLSPEAVAIAGRRGGVEERRGGQRQSRWQRGQRGSDRESARAMARRNVVNESAKCRSGREGERTCSTRASGRGGKSADSLGDDERVATQHDGDVVMPAHEAASLEVIE